MQFLFMKRILFFAILLSSLGPIYPQSKEEKNPDLLKMISNTYFLMGALHYHKKEYAEAIVDFSRAITEDPKYAQAYHYRGASYHDKGLYDKAILDYTKAIKFDPENDELHSRRGDNYIHKGLYDRALLDLNKAIRINPKECLCLYKSW